MTAAIKTMSFATRPKKSLGQNFLKNKHILELIADAAELRPGETVVEIGPGTGTLTDVLLARGVHVIAIEKDKELASQLKVKYQKNKNIELLEADILNYKPEAIGYKLIGNIPYYLTSHLLRTVLQDWPQPELIVLMVQKEVAKRITARPPEMNMLAVLVQLYTAPTIIKIVKAGNFHPKPKVDSAIIRLSPSQPPPYRKGEAKEGDMVLSIAAKGFAHPRKKLANNLPLELLAAAGIDPNRRAGTLTLDEWKSLAKIQA